MSDTDRDSAVLSRLSSAEVMLREATEPQHAIDIADVAEAARVYAKRAGAALPVINHAASIKISAERKAGEMLRRMEKAKNRHSSNTALVSLGITPNQSSRWQRAALVPEDAFRAFVNKSTVEGKEITSAAVYKLANHFAPKNGAQPAERTTGTATEISDLLAAGLKYGTIYVDPPWAYDNQGTRAATGNHYQTLAVPALCAMPIGQLAAAKSHLHLWTTNAFLFECPQIFAAWGFEFKSSFIWVKPNIGIGNYWRNSHEIMLLAVRGGQTAISKSERSWIECKRGMHSAKPEKVRHMIEKLSPGPYLELFGRAPRGGWTVFGNQIVEELVTL